MTTISNDTVKSFFAEVKIKLASSSRLDVIKEMEEEIQKVVRLIGPVSDDLDHAKLIASAVVDMANMALKMDITKELKGALLDILAAVDEPTERKVA